MVVAIGEERESKNNGGGIYFLKSNQRGIWTQTVSIYM